MKNNGRVHVVRLGTRVFTEEQALTEAGRLQLQWIVTQAPVNRGLSSYCVALTQTIPRSHRGRSSARSRIWYQPALATDLGHRC